MWRRRSPPNKYLRSEQRTLRETEERGDGRGERGKEGRVHDTMTTSWCTGVIDISNASPYNTACNHLIPPTIPTSTAMLTRPERYIPSTYRVHTPTPHPAPQCRTSQYMHIHKPFPFISTRPQYISASAYKPDRPPYVCRAAPVPDLPCSATELVAVRPVIDRERRGIFDRLWMQLGASGNAASLRPSIMIRLERSGKGRMW